MTFGKNILKYWDDILKDLEAIIAVPSVSVDTAGPHPFGDDAAKAIDIMMDLSQQYGLKAKNVDYYAMHAEYGEGDGNAVVMAHIDVVPAGDGWNTDPYKLVIKDGKAFGRGVLDDKGAAVIALHCLRALKDAGIQGKRKLRVVLGASEETGMRDMEHYFAQEQHPDMGFTPDGDYGICHCEKGILTYTVNAENDSKIIKTFTSGTVSNAVPDKAYCEIFCSDEEFARLTDTAAAADIDFIVTKTDFCASVSAIGKASHAAMPETGVNAASYLIELLYNVFGDKIGTFFTHIYERIGTAYDGSKMSLNISDEESGPLTFNLGIVHADENKCDYTVNIRYPATKNGDDISSKIKNVVEDDKLSYTLDADAKPLYVPKDSALIQLLSRAYTDVTGEKCDIYSMGGGTYARHMFDKGVAFGPVFPAHPDGAAHTANEFAYLENMKLHAQICLEAMYLMLTAETETE